MLRAAVNEKLKKNKLSKGGTGSRGTRQIPISRAVSCAWILCFGSQKTHHERASSWPQGNPRTPLPSYLYCPLPTRIWQIDEEIPPVGIAAETVKPQQTALLSYFRGGQQDFKILETFLLSSFGWRTLKELTSCSIIRLKALYRVILRIKGYTNRQSPVALCILS